MLLQSNHVSYFLVLSFACHYFLSVLAEFDMNSPLLFPLIPLVCSEVLLRRRTKVMWSFLEA